MTDSAIELGRIARLAGIHSVGTFERRDSDVGVAILAHLDSADRLIPAGGMALTAEQVEDVRIVLGQLERGGPAFEAAHDRLRALFPATEPAERTDHGSVDDGMGSEWQRCKVDCGIEVVRPGKTQCDCTEPTDEDEADDISGFMDALKASRAHNYAPAEPDKEETKAEAIEALTEAIRFTVEYVWLNTLPPIEGWSWYDALLKYAPEKAKAFLDAYTPPVNPSPAEHVTTETGQRIVNTTVLTEVADERARQDAKWGEQNHPNVDHVLMTREGGASPARMAEHYELPTAGRAKFLCDQAADFGQVTYAHILIEEVAEVVEAATRASVTELRAELIQVAAVAVAWVEKLDREATSSPVVPAPTETEWQTDTLRDIVLRGLERIDTIPPNELRWDFPIYAESEGGPKYTTRVGTQWVLSPVYESAVLALVENLRRVLDAEAETGPLLGSEDTAIIRNDQS